VHLGFPLSKRGPRTLNEAHSMATIIEQNISLSEIRYLFTSGSLSREIVVSLENIIFDFHEEGEQTMDQHRTVEDTVEELEPKKNGELSTALLPLMRSSTNHLILQNKRMMRLVSFLFRITRTPCSMI
jgi:hypothetical protein